MAYTLAESVTKVRELLNEPVAAFWSDVELQGWIQEASLDVSSKLLCAINNNVLTLSSGQYRYTASDETWIGNCLRIKGGLYLPSSSTPRGLQRIEVHQIGHSNRVDTEPTFFYHDSPGRAIYISPTPGAAEASETIEINNSYQTNDITNIPDEYQPITFIYALYKAKLKEKQFGEARFNFELYTSIIGFERNDKYDFGSKQHEDLKIK